MSHVGPHVSHRRREHHHDGRKDSLEAKGGARDDFGDSLYLHPVGPCESTDVAAPTLKDCRRGMGEDHDPIRHPFSTAACARALSVYRFSWFTPGWQNADRPE